jgi:hypothetical protein
MQNDKNGGRVRLKDEPKHQILMSSPLFLLKLKWFKKKKCSSSTLLLPLENAFLLTAWFKVHHQTNAGPWV